jgi:Ca-activated chloride channel family protein
MESFRFENTVFLYALLVLPVLAVFYWYSNYRSNRKLRKWGDRKLLALLMPLSSRPKRTWKFILFLLAIASLVFALARPQFGSKLTDVKRKGVEIMIALDVSNSMLAEDILPSRLENAKRAISKLVDELENDKIGLIVFAGDAYIQLPITTDFGAAKLFLASVNTQIVPRQGTSIGAAIDLASRSFTPEADKSKAIIIITDGENHEEGAIEAAEAAAEKGIVVHTIGMGLSKGAPIPVYNQYGQKDFRKDNEGNVIISKLNENLLREVAAAGKGIYIRANNANTGLKTLFEEINKMDKQEIEARVYSEYEEQFQYLVFLAIFLLVVELIILERKNKWIRKLRIIDKE